MVIVEEEGRGIQFHKQGDRGDPIAGPKPRLQECQMMSVLRFGTGGVTWGIYVGRTPSFVSANGIYNRSSGTSNPESNTSHKPEFRIQDISPRKSQRQSQYISNLESSCTFQQSFASLFSKKLNTDLRNLQSTGTPIVDRSHGGYQDSLCPSKLYHTCSTSIFACRHLHPNGY